MSLKEEIRKHILETERADLAALNSMHELSAKAADLDEESPLGYEDFAKQEENRESARSLAIRIDRAQDILNTFLQLDFGVKSKVEPGALVVTDSVSFLIGMASAAFEYQSRHYIGVNIDAPIYTALVDAKIGDNIVFNNKKYKILDIL